MTKVNETAHAVFVGGAALAHTALFARLLGRLESKGVLSRADVEQLLTDTAAGFRHPLATDMEGGAVGLIMGIRDQAAAAR